MSTAIQEFKMEYLHKAGCGERSGSRGVVVTGSVVAVALLLGACGKQDATTGTSTAAPNVQTTAAQTGADTADETSDTPDVPDVLKTELAQAWEFEPDVVDFGYVPPRQSATTTFKVWNRSDEPLGILTMKTTCKCTTLEDLDNTTIQPGEFAEITATIDPRDAGGLAQSKVKFVFKEHGAASVDVVARFSRSVQTNPGYIRSLSDEELVGEILVASRDGQPFRVLRANGEPPDFVDYDPNSGETREQYVIRWDVGDYDAESCVNSRGERMRRWWIIETDHPHAPIVDVTLRHMCNLPERPNGRTWRPAFQHELVGVVAPGEPIEFELGFKPAFGNKGDVNLRVRDVLAESSGVNAEVLDIQGIGADSKVRVRVTPPADARGLFYETLRIFSDQHSAPVTIIASIRES